MDAHLWGHTGTCFLFFSQMWCRFYTACSLVTQRRWLSLILWSCLCAHIYEKVALKLLEAQDWGWLGIVPEWLIIWWCNRTISQGTSSCLHIGLMYLPMRQKILRLITWNWLMHGIFLFKWRLSPTPNASSECIGGKESGRCMGLLEEIWGL